MPLTFEKLHPRFAAEVGPIDLRRVRDPETLAEIRAGMDEYAVLVFRDQPFADDEQIAFAQRLDGELHTKTGSSALRKSRLGNEALGDISNVDENGDLLQSDDRRRMYGLGNRLWHTDASFQDPPGRYSMLSARIIPPVDADTEFADTRAAYDALPASMKATIEGLRVHHSIAHSRRTLGFEFSKDQYVLFSPEELLDRLAEGKVYVPEQAQRAVQNFFQKGNLHALRELALRRTAERVDAEVLAYRKQHGIASPWICPWKREPSTRSSPCSSRSTNGPSSWIGYVSSASPITT